MRILLIYPGHSCSTIDIAIGYENALRDLGHDVTAYDYHNYLLFYNRALIHWVELNPSFELDNLMEAMLFLASGQAVLQAVAVVPDVVIIVCGFALHRRAYDLLHRLALPLVLILTESPYLDEEQTTIIDKGHLSLVFTNDKSSVIPLREATGVRTEYLPHSYDPWRHGSQDVGPECQSDIFFFGTLWPERKRLLYPFLRWARRWRPGWNTEIGGIETPVTETENTVDNAELIRWYNGAQIALNHHRTCISIEDGQEQHIAGAYSLGPRAYEIAACGTFQLCDDTRQELRDTFGDTVATYTDAADLRHKADYYMARPDEREEMGWAAHDRVQACSFEERATTILLPNIKEVLNHGGS